MAELPGHDNRVLSATEATADASEPRAVKRSPKPPRPTSKPNIRPPPIPSPSTSSPPPPSPKPAGGPRAPPSRKPPGRPKPPPSPTRPPRPKPSPSPSSKPAPPPSPSTAGYGVCIAVQLLSPLDSTGRPTYTFGDPIDCLGTARSISNDITTAAASFGARLAAPFELATCSGAYEPGPNPKRSPSALPNITVCGAFTSAADAGKLQVGMQPLMTSWTMRLVGREVPPPEAGTWTNPYSCPPPGYTAVALAWGPGQDTALLGYQQVSCSAEEVAASPRPPAAKAAQCSIPSGQDKPYSLPSGLYPSTAAAASGGGRQLCTIVLPAGCGASSACCTRATTQILLPVSRACTTTLSTAVLLDGQAAGASYILLAGQDVLEITLPGTIQLKRNGSELCIPVPPAGPCAYPKSFCATPDCQASLRSNDSRCCRAGQSGAPPPMPVDNTGSVPVCTYLASRPGRGPTSPLSRPVSIDCAVFADLVAQGWAWAADAQGARIATPFTLKTCTPGSQLPGSLDLPSIEVCGAFASAAEAERLAGSVNALVTYWLQSLSRGTKSDMPIGGAVSVCPPLGFTFEAFVETPLESLFYFREVECPDERVIPSAPPSRA